MFVTDLKIKGLRGAHGYDESGFEAVVEVDRATVGVAVADALSLLSAALSAPRFQGVFRDLQLTRLADSLAISEAGGFVDQATGLDAAAVSSLLHPEADRKVTVQAELMLDPPLYGRLSQHAARDPRVVTALGQRPALGIKVGFLFNQDQSAVAVSVLGTSIGDVQFPTLMSERPQWVTELLMEVGTRFGRVNRGRDLAALGRRFLDAYLSTDPVRRARFFQLRRAVVARPFSLESVELVRAGGRVEICLGDELVRARQFGPVAVEALQLLDAVYLDAPDVLVAESVHNQAWASWLRERMHGDDATLEQVVLVQGP